MKARIPLGIAMLLGIFLIFPVDAGAQSIKQKQRPLKGSPNTNLPSYPSLNAYVHASAGKTKNLRERATVVGKANLKWQPLTSSFQPIKHNSTHSDFSAVLPYRMIKAPNGTVRWFEGKLDMPAHARLSAGKRHGELAYTATALATFDKHQKMLNLENPSDELRSVHTSYDKLGFAHTRFEQVYEDIPVWGRDILVHFDDRGEIYALNGAYEPTPKSVDTTPQLNVLSAEQIVEADLKAQQRWAPLDEATLEMMDMKQMQSRLVI